MVPYQDTRVVGGCVKLLFDIITLQQKQTV
jgi:hypothetical protein